MKFLCIACDEPMKLQEASPPDAGGSLSVVYGCPTCGTRIAMLTNPYETQLVQSLGVRIGPPATAGAAAGAGSAAERAAAGGCPFSGMLREMEERAPDAVAWTAEALARLERVPEMVRPMARQGIEHYAKSHGHRVVDETVMAEARGSFGM